VITADMYKLMKSGQMSGELFALMRSSTLSTAEAKMVMAGVGMTAEGGARAPYISPTLIARFEPAPNVATKSALGMAGVLPVTAALVGRPPLPMIPPNLNRAALKSFPAPANQPPPGSLPAYLPVGAVMSPMRRNIPAAVLTATAPVWAKLQSGCYS